MTTRDMWRMVDMWQRTAANLKRAGMARAAERARRLWRAWFDRASNAEALAEAVGLETSGRAL